MRLSARPRRALSAVVLAGGLTAMPLVPLSPVAPQAPAQAATAAAGYPSGVRAKGAAVEDASTGAMLWGRKAGTERPIASITKVMTALVVIRAGHLNRLIRVPAAVVRYVRQHDASNAGLHPGDWLTARQLLEGLMLPSGCDAAYILATAYGPGRPAFVAKMNARAAALGLTHTHFANFDGLPWPTETSTYSTPADLIALGRAAMHHPVFRAIVAQKTYQLAAGSSHHAYIWHNTNQLLARYPGTIGIKTGDTLGAGYCLLFAAERGNVELIGVVLHSSATSMTVAFSDAAKVLNWGFDHD